MHFGSSWADRELIGDGRICLTFGGQLQYLALSRRQCLVGIYVGSLGLVYLSLDSKLREWWTQVAATRNRFVDCAQQFIDACILQYITICTVG